MTMPAVKFWAEITLGYLENEGLKVAVVLFFRLTEKMLVCCWYELVSGSFPLRRNVKMDDQFIRIFSKILLLATINFIE